MIPIIFKTPGDAIHVDKESGTSVDYHIFDEYEIHINRVMPHTVQEWHSHTKIIETLFVTKGKLLFPGCLILICKLVVSCPLFFREDRIGYCCSLILRETVIS